MIGRAMFRVASPPRRWLVRVWGEPSIHTRQKWWAIWPQLSRLSSSHLRVLDAGCGCGMWSIELAVRRPAWSITGLDQSGECISAAEAVRQRLHLENVEFTRAEFQRFRPAERFDVVLSVASAHYLINQGTGEQLFRTFRTWLKPDGLLCVLVPRRGAEIPSWPLLPPPFEEMRDVVAEGVLPAFCRVSGLKVQTIAGVVGVWGTLAKQLNRAVGKSHALSLLSYPFQLALATVDRVLPMSMRRKRSSHWLLVATRPRPLEEGSAVPPLASTRIV